MDKMLQPQQSIGAALAAGPQSPRDINGPVFFNPEPCVKGARTPSKRGGRRKQTLLALIDELSTLQEEELEKEREKSFDDEVQRLIITKDEHMHSDPEGIERFKTFDDRIKKLDLKLQVFSNVVRQLGSSGGLLNSAYHLRARLRQIQYFFRENAAELLDTITHAPNDGTPPYSARKWGKIRPENAKPWSTEIEDLPREMEKLVEDLDVFSKRLCYFREFTDGAINASITAFQGDLRYRASCLREFEGQLRFLAVSRYINDITEDFLAHTENIVKHLDMLIDVGVPLTRLSQERNTARLQNLSTVATFLSGVTATTLQFSYEDHGNFLPDLVNALWFTSLVFSIASAINSQLAYHWHVSFYRSPELHLPSWMPILLTSTPVFLLVGSLLTFLAGLCAFTYSSGQSPTVSTVITSFAAITFSALLCVGLWFISERWTFARTKGSRWLLDIIEEHGKKAVKVTRLIPTKKVAKHSVQCIQRALNGIRRRPMTASIAGRIKHTWGIIKSTFCNLFSSITSSLAIATDGTNINARGDEESQYDMDRTESPTAMFNGESSDSAVPANSQSEKHKLPNRGRGDEDNILEDDIKTPPELVVNPPSTNLTAPNCVSTSLGDTDAPRLSEEPQPNARFRALVRQVIQTFRVVPHVNIPNLPVDSVSPEPPSGMRDPRSMLRALRSDQLLTEHLALVKHLQFSPDGQFLATCSWDRTALIWRVGAGPGGEFELMHKLVHTARVGGFIGQVAWSPSGEQLLTKQLKSIKVWDANSGVCERTIDRRRNVQAITWMPKAPRFLTIEWKTESSQASRRMHQAGNILGSDLVIVNTDGTQFQEYHLPRLQVWDAAVVPDEERLVAVATLLRTEQDRRPVKSRHEKRILIYNLNTREIENQVPLLQDVRDITLTEEGNYALVSYENKAPPQAWRIDKILREGKLRLALARTYYTKHPVDFAGPSYFGGVKDTFVLAASKSGEIYMWERSSGELLHSLKAPDQELTNLAWNQKSSGGFMLASAAHDGMVRIWTTTAAAPPPRSLAPSLAPYEVESPGPLRQEYYPGIPPGRLRLP